MKIGFANIFSWRPHNKMARRFVSDCVAAGLDVSIFRCAPNSNGCYDKYVSPFGLVTCMKCKLLGLSAGGADYFSSKKKIHLSSDEVRQYRKYLESTVSSIRRCASYGEINDPQSDHYFDVLAPNFHRITLQAEEWITNQKLDFVVLFNGRFDLTKAVMEACRRTKVEFVTHERTWFGPGLNLNWNNNCMSLDKYVGYSNYEFSLRQKLAYAAPLFAPRIDLNRTSSEWRNYASSFKNKISISSSKTIILVLPSSPSEWLGEASRDSDFSDIFASLETIAKKYPNEEVIVKGHPIWRQRIKKLEIPSIEKKVKVKCQELGIRFIPSDDLVNVNDLIVQSDVIISFGSSAALHGGWFGKPVILLGKAEYQYAKFVTCYPTIKSFLSSEVSELNSNADKKKTDTLEFIFDFCFTKMHFTDKLNLARSSRANFCKTFDFSTILGKTFEQNSYRPTLLDGESLPSIEQSLSLTKVSNFKELFPWQGS